MNLDELSNEEIRLKLLEYGFANLPVTQTTRKVLVKKLKNAIDTQKTKTRRETVAIISKSSDEEEIPKDKKRERTPNRRATIAVTEKTKKLAVTSSSESIPKSDASSKETTTSRRSSRATPAKEKPIVSSTGTIIDEDTDDDVVEVRTYTTRRSKTPTISKSETVRTSYKSETVSDAIPEKKRIIEAIEVPKVQVQTATRRKTYTTNNFELPTRTETPTKFGTASLTTSYNPNHQNYRYEKEHHEDYDFDEKDTPYLSSFAKRLSTLKAEPLNSGYSKPKYSELNDEYSTKGSYSRYSQMAGSSTYKPAKKGVVHQMAKDFNSLDRKYSIRKYVYIAMLIMLIIAIYVILFM